jgi:DNA invertase Pin-like site-specific DNA recombinase
MTEIHPQRRLIRYARGSTYWQTLDSQLEQLRAAGCSSRNIYRDKVTGARPDRRELNRMLGKFALDDVVTVTRIDRLARSTFDIFGIVKRMWTAPEARGQGVARRVLHELEALARNAGIETLRLDTNRVLVEAQAMYRRAGYREIARYNDNPYAHHWFEKNLEPAADPT